MTGPVVLAAGGTGGHLFPAQALAAELVRRMIPVALLTDRRAAGYDTRFPGVDVHVVPSGTPAARGVMAKVRAGLDIALGVVAALRLLRRIRPSVVVGFGGYPSLPTMVAAQRLGLPTLIHEQNAVLGRVNRLVAGHAAAIAASILPLQSVRAADEPKVVLTGNPVRDEVRAVHGVPYSAPDTSGEIRLLVLGGSQGATVLSDVVPAALASLPDALRPRLRVVQQCRPEDLIRVRAAYDAANINADLASFIADVPTHLANCHLAITRAGASTVAELTVAGRPSILVPYLHAMDDHQTANARALQAGGATLVMPQREFTSVTLRDALQALLLDGNRLTTMAGAAHRLGRPDAAAALAVLVAGHGRNGGKATMARAA